MLSVTYPDHRTASIETVSQGNKAKVATAESKPSAASQLTLKPQQIVRTVEILRERIHERFPGSGLSGLAENLVQAARNTLDRLHWVTEPHWPLRVGIAL